MREGLSGGAEGGGVGLCAGAGLLVSSSVAVGPAWPGLALIPLLVPL